MGLTWGYSRHFVHERPQLIIEFQSLRESTVIRTKYLILIAAAATFLAWLGIGMAFYGAINADPSLYIPLIILFCACAITALFFKGKRWTSAGIVLGSLVRFVVSSFIVDSRSDYAKAIEIGFEGVEDYREAGRLGVKTPAEFFVVRRAVAALAKEQAELTARRRQEEAELAVRQKQEEAERVVRQKQEKEASCLNDLQCSFKKFSVDA